MRLIIAEKASLARSIADAIATQSNTRVQSGENCYKAGGDVVAYCSGHILREFEPHQYNPAWEKWDMAQLPMIPTEFKLAPDATKAGLIKTIREQAALATDIVHAGDPDREGQAIVNNVLTHIGCKKQVNRIWLKELNVPGIIKALGVMKPNSAYNNLFDSARARIEADWGIGLNTTRAFSIAYSRQTGLRGKDGTLHVGRVTTPTLGLVVARDLEIENFVPQDYFTLKVEAVHANGCFSALWQAPAGATFLDAEGRTKSKQAVAAIATRINGNAGKIASLKVEPKRQIAPLPFTLSELQKTANKCGLSPADTLAVAQRLYEKHKLTSYPRTDCPYLPEAEHRDAPAKLAAAKANFVATGDWPFLGTPDFKLKSRAYNDKLLGAHTGIVPTTQRANLSALSPNETLVYRLVVRNFLGQFYGAYEYESTVVGLVCEKEQFKATGTVEKNAGWKVLFRVSCAQDNDDENATPLPLMKNGDPVKIARADVKAEKTKPSPRFDGGSLIDAMKNVHKFVTDPAVKQRLRETEGIGTEATRANIIEQLLRRGYLSEVRAGKKSHYVSTEKGRLTIRVLPTEITKPDLTGWFEGQLEKIVSGELAIADFRLSLHQFETKLVAGAKSGSMAACANAAPAKSATVKPAAVAATPKSARQSAKTAHAAGAGSRTCPDCQSPLIARNRQSDQSKFFGCSTYPACRHTENA